VSRVDQVRHEFVEFIPSAPQEGVVYVSISYATVVHLCCCGCGQEVVTPLAPTDWTLVFDGDSISLKPSIGNWGLPCRSHYWIIRNRVRWAKGWTDKKIAERRAEDRRGRAAFFARGRSTELGIAKIKPD
jgi:hypothetical protein